MKCPHCGQNIGGPTCPSCGLEVLEESRFCHGCGVRLEARTAKVSSSDDEDLDFSKRILCSDGTCIGVINERGFCKVCGKPHREDPP